MAQARATRNPAWARLVVPVLVFCLGAGTLLVSGCCSRRSTNTGPGTGETTAPGVTGPARTTGATGGATGGRRPGGEDIEDTLGSGKEIVSLPRARIPSAEFTRRHEEGMNLADEEKYGPAIEVFEDLIRRFPNTEEASVAAYCIAEIHFRNKNNALALAAYKDILQKYPNTQAAISAAEGIRYLETFDEVQRNFISPEVEDLKRRGY